ncbi:type IV toxin-antitoxin system AbiEi family antitoxin domain-containing protein [Fodinibius salsisoli]
MRDKGGYATMKELKEAGIHTRKIKEARRKNLLIKLSQGFIS